MTWPPSAYTVIEPSRRCPSRATLTCVGAHLADMGSLACADPAVANYVEGYFPRAASTRRTSTRTSARSAHLPQVAAVSSNHPQL